MGPYPNFHKTLLKALEGLWIEVTGLKWGYAAYLESHTIFRGSGFWEIRNNTLHTYALKTSGSDAIFKIKENAVCCSIPGGVKHFPNLVGIVLCLIFDVSAVNPHWALRSIT